MPDLSDLPTDPAQAGRMQVVQSSRFGRVGIDLFVPATLADDYRAFLASRFRFLGEEEAEGLRIAAGVPRWGAELGEDTMPAEAGLEARAVSYNKGCYIGQEVVSRIKSVGHVNWQLRGFNPISGERLQPGMIPPRSCFWDKPRRGQHHQCFPGGRSFAFTRPVPESARFLALGYVRRGSEAANTRLDVFPAGAASGPAVSPTALSPVAQVEVSALPFST